MWEGQSVDLEGSITRWSDTTLVFTHQGAGPLSDCLKVEGSGMSLWQRRNLKLIFDVIGTCRWSAERGLLEVW